MVTRTCSGSNRTAVLQDAKTKVHPRDRQVRIHPDEDAALREVLLAQCGEDLLEGFGGSLILRNEDGTPKCDGDGVRLLAPDLSDESGQGPSIAYLFSQPRQDAAVSRIASQALAS